MRLQLERLDILGGCVGWQLESQAAEAGTLGVQLRLGELFRLVLEPATGAGSFSLVEAREAPRLGADWRALALRLMGAAPGAPPYHPNCRLPRSTHYVGCRSSAIAAQRRTHLYYFCS